MPTTTHETSAVTVAGEIDRAELYHGIIAAAVLAPSSHNSQPWVFEPCGDRLRVHADRGR